MPLLGLDDSSRIAAGIDPAAGIGEHVREIAVVSISPPK